MGEAHWDYARLEDVESGPDECRSAKKFTFWWWVRVILLGICLAAGAAAVVIFVAPLIIKKVIIPILDWEEVTFSRLVLGWLLFACMALFPALLLPSSPCMWLAGLTFGYGYGFLLITAGISIGMSLPFFIGSLFHPKIHRWLEKWPKKAAIVRLAGGGDWFHQFRAVALIRVSPFPYIIFNYAAVATNVTYGPYILGSLVGTVHETFITIYTGRLLGNVADAASSGGFLSMEQVIYDAIGFCITAAATAAITIYAKKALQDLQFEDEELS